MRGTTGIFSKKDKKRSLFYKRQKIKTSSKKRKEKKDKKNREKKYNLKKHLYLNKLENRLSPQRNLPGASTRELESTREFSKFKIDTFLSQREFLWK